MENNKDMKSQDNETARKTILIIEDDKDINDLLCSIVKSAGHEAKSAMTGGDGLEMMRKEPPDLLILDIMLPDIDGINIKKEMSDDSVLKSVPVIVVSAKTDVNSKLMSFISGVRRYITKPFTFEEALGAIQAVFRQQELSSNVSGYRNACSPGGDFGAFPTDVEGAKAECEQNQDDENKEE